MRLAWGFYGLSPVYGQLCALYTNLPDNRLGMHDRLEMGMLVECAFSIAV